MILECVKLGLISEEACQVGGYCVKEALKFFSVGRNFVKIGLYRIDPFFTEPFFQPAL